MYCKNCGEKIEDGRSECDSCKISIDEKEEVKKSEVIDNKIDLEKDKEDEKNANLLCVISLILYFGSGTISGIFAVLSSVSGTYISSFTGLCPLAGIVLMIIARVKYPKNKFAKILMWIYIILTLISIIAVIIVIAACVYACGNIDMSSLRNCG